MEVYTFLRSLFRPRSPPLLSYLLVFTFPKCHLWDNCLRRNNALRTIEATQPQSKAAHPLSDLPSFYIISLSRCSISYLGREGRGSEYARSFGGYHHIQICAPLPLASPEGLQTTNPTETATADRLPRTYRRRSTFSGGSFSLYHRSRVFLPLPHRNPGVANSCAGGKATLLWTLHCLCVAARTCGLFEEEASEFVRRVPRHHTDFASQKWRHKTSR